MLQQEITLAADPEAIRRDLSYMTARWHELDRPCVFEVRAFKENCQAQRFKYSPDWIDEAVNDIVAMNARGFNIYAVRNPIRDDVKGSASDTDIIAAFFLWADCDDPVSANNVYRFDGPKWSAAVTTGSIPSVRVHTYWQLEQPCTDLAEWREMQARIASHFGSDSTVINPSRIMRVGGTVSYPDSKKQARGYIAEATKLRTEYSDARAPVTLEQMHRVFGERQAPLPLSRQATAPAPVASFAIDVGASPSLNREQMAIQALSGVEWHNAVIKLVGSYVAKGLSDTEIHALTQPLTLAGYTGEQTAREVQTAIDGARRKGFAPEAYASPAAIVPPQSDASFDAPKISHAGKLEWFDDTQAALTDGYLIKGILAQNSMAVLYGPSNSGKTFFTLDIAYHLATGAAWFGNRVKPAAVLYLASEGGRGVLNRIAALKQETGECDVPLALRRAGLDLLHDQANLQELVDLAGEVSSRYPGKPLLIVIDTLSRVMAGGDENSAADMTSLIRNIDGIREVTGATVLLVHHTGKDAARGARGHSSLRAATDTEIEVGNENGARMAMVTKQRDYQGGENFAFTLKSVTLGKDQDGDDVTSCVLVPADAEEQMAKIKLTKGLGGNQKILADTFDQMLAEGLGKPNPSGVGLPESGRFWAVPMDDFKAHCMGKMAASNKRGAFSEAWSAISANRGLFCAASDLVWRTDRKVK